MPTPQSQRLELLYVLRKARELHCTISVDEIEQSMTSVGMLNGNKRHLQWLVPLVSRLGRLARHDGEIADACAGVLEAAVVV